MSDSIRNDFERQFVDGSLSTIGIELSLSEVAAARGPEGDYGQYPHLHACWNRFNVALKSKTHAGDAQ